MAIFLSSSMLKSKTDKGGYCRYAPAIVYNTADQKIMTTAGLAGSAAEAGITKTALVMIGRFLDSPSDRSKLYDPSFTHEFREAAE